MIAALFVAEKGPYASDPRFDAWGVTRDARSYAGPAPVVAHPPCERWGRFAEGSPTNKRFQLGDDGGCFEAALAAVRRSGGVIEHPQGSHAFRHFGLPIPPRRGWSVPDRFGGRSCYIDQGAYGHPAKKPTWLYAVLPAFPDLNWTRVWGRPRIGGDGFHSTAERARAKARVGGKPRFEQVPAEWNWRTPDDLKTVLHDLAASCIGWTPPPPRTRQPSLLSLLQDGRPVDLSGIEEGASAMVDCRIVTPQAAMGPTMKALAEGHRAKDCPRCSSAIEEVRE